MTEIQENVMFTAPIPIIQQMDVLSLKRILWKYKKPLFRNHN